MNDQLPMFDQMTSEDTGSATSSPGSGSGPTRSGLPDGKTTGKYGPGRVPANPSAWPAKARRSTTKGIFGQSGLNLSGSANRPLSSESKSRAQASSDLKTCKGCHVTKPMGFFRRHNRNGFRGTCRVCENRWVRTTKPGNLDRKREYQREVRNKKRGLRLTTDAKQRAKSKGIPFSLNWRDIQAKIDAGICEATGIPFDLATPKSWNAPSIDQIVPGLGYTPENTRVILFALNAMANSWGFSRILEIADALRARGFR